LSPRERAERCPGSRSARRFIIFEQWECSSFPVNVSEFIEDITAHVPRFASALLQVDAATALSASPMRDFRAML